MTAREKQIVRQAIDQARRAQIKPRSQGGQPGQLKDGLALVQAIVTEREPRIYGHCPLCGDPCRGRACPAHQELVEQEQRLLRRRAA